MSVLYAHKMARGGYFGRFWKLLFLWRGSVYKLIYCDLLVWLMIYASLSIMRRYFLGDNEILIFDKLCLYCNKFSDLIPLPFVLGFYVSLIVNRWWIMWDTLPWPDDIAMFVTAILKGQDERARLMRRTIMRYVNLAGVHTMALFSGSVRRRFPTLDHLVAAGLLEEGEKQIFEEMSGRITKLYWMPLVWATAIVTKARREKLIDADISMKTMIDHLCDFRRKCEKSLHIEVINVPLVYTQVVTIAVYAYFLANLFGRQFTGERDQVDAYLPVFTVFQFLVYMGWMKVAETLINPYGDDDDDFELNWLIDRHLQVSYMIVDEMHATHPELVKDAYWDEVLPNVLPNGDGAAPRVEAPHFAGSFCDLTSRKVSPSVPNTPEILVDNSLKVPEFRLKKPPAYKRFLSNYAVRDENSGSHGALHRKDSLSVSMQIGPLPKRSTTVSDKMYKFFFDRPSTGSRQFVAQNEVNMPLTTVMEDEPDKPEEENHDQTESTTTTPNQNSSTTTLPLSMFGSHGSGLTEAVYGHQGNKESVACGNRLRSVSYNVDTNSEGDQSPGILLMVPQLNNPANTENDKGA